jgi:predicted RNase H-like HicB family nuclease
MNQPDPAPGKQGTEPGWLPDDELTREWLRLVEQYRAECDAADRRRFLDAPDPRGGGPVRLSFLEGRSMRIPILIETGERGGFRAHAGGPFTASADGKTATEATENLAALLRERLKAGARLAVLDIGVAPQVLAQAPLQLEPLPDEDWFFQTMRGAIEENRKREDEVSRDS